MRIVVGSSDIVVIGAGIVGCAVARELTRRGASVSILDQRTPGAGATHASGGMLAPYSESTGGDPLLALGARSLSLFDEFVATLEAETGISVGYERSGTLHVGRNEAAMSHLDVVHRELSGLGVASEQLSASEVRVQETNLAPDVRGGLLIPTQGLVSAPDLTRALVASARTLGATLLQSTRALRLGRLEKGITIETARGHMHAGSVVLAAGAWSGQLVMDGVTEAVPVKPVRGQLLHLAWQGTPISRITWDDTCYLVPWRDGTLLVGATVEDAGFDERTTVSGVRQLLDAVCGLFPNASTAQLLSARAGLRPGSPDPLPIIGWSSVLPGLMYATGHYRNGVLLAPLTAQLVAGAMIDGVQDPALQLTTPSRFGI